MFNRQIIIALVIFLSLGSIHYVTFIIGIPTELRSLIDMYFKLNFVSNLLLVSTFSIVVARYFPVFLLAVFVFVIEQVVMIKYWRRGYRRAATPYRMFETDLIRNPESRKAFAKRLKRFGKKDARLDNLVSDQVQSLLPVLIYEKNKVEVTVLLAIFIFQIFYIGYWHSFLLSAGGVVFFGMYRAYLSYNSSFRFRISGVSFAADDPNYSPSSHGFDSEDLLILAVTCALVVAIAGPIRLSAILEGPSVRIVTGDQWIVGRLVGATGNGIIYYENDYKFTPFTEIWASGADPNSREK